MIWKHVAYIAIKKRAARHIIWAVFISAVRTTCGVNLKTYLF